MKFKKEFNSSAPNKPERHYTLERSALMEKGKKLLCALLLPFLAFLACQNQKETSQVIFQKPLNNVVIKVCEAYVFFPIFI
jgi:hypothetical protein